ncbi:G-protein coupled receptor Mth-like [Lingula anatina]|uniref:G-protein coupled receptor Mth-like n=1 Tax=Lingula anatina TaxID=7574 RepID=A0A1S3K1H8_LINAN|nr:G-protein coupled receptor Mth-like [Lingula anatina]|eukprot:XP_013416485.1 G-protein coupled receptor Mth-like [Lingula anatina]
MRWYRAVLGSLVLIFTSAVQNSHGSLSGKESMNTSLQANPEHCHTRASCNSSDAERNCYCDEVCILYEDCCKDFHPAELTNNNLTKKYMLQLAREIKGLFECMTLSTKSSGYVISKCPQKWSGPNEIKINCEHNFNKTKSFDQFMETPVVGKRTGLVFRNVFCSICHEVDDIAYYSVKFGCSVPQSSTHPMGPPGRRPNFQPPAGVPLDSMDVNVSHVFNECSRTYKYKGTHLNRKTCVKYISTCSDKSSQYRKLCEDTPYVSFVYHNETHETYKNRFCAMCNGIEERRLNCIKKENATSSLPMYSYSVLFDLNTATLELKTIYSPYPSTAEYQKCPHGQTIEFGTNSCRTLMCEQDKVLKGNKCVQVSDTFLNRSYNSSIEKELLCPHLNYSTFVLFPNGELYINKTGQYFTSDDYRRVDENSVLVCVSTYGNQTEDVVQFNFSAIQTYLSSIGLIISSICLSIHFVIYMMLPSLRNRPGKILLHYVASLFGAQILFLISPRLGSITHACYIFSVLLHFMYLVAFLWMNIMSFDICHTFSNPTQVSSSQRCSKTFIIYHFYVWFFAFTIITIALVVDFSDDVPITYKPGYGNYGLCWLTQKYGLLIFFIGPVSAILLANLILFAISAYNITKVSNDTNRIALLNKSSEKRNLLLFVKLSVVMGITWITGFVAMATNRSELWFLFIFLNTWLGVFLFLVYICNKNVFQLLRKKFGCHTKKNLRNSKSNSSAVSSMRNRTSTTELSIVRLNTRL